MKYSDRSSIFPGDILEITGYDRNWNGCKVSVEHVCANNVKVRAIVDMLGCNANSTMYLMYRYLKPSKSTLESALRELIR